MRMIADQGGAIGKLGALARYKADGIYCDDELLPEAHPEHGYCNENRNDGATSFFLPAGNGYPAMLFFCKSYLESLKPEK